MQICVIGTGYVGLVVGTCLAEMGNYVICVDNDTSKLELLKKGIVPIYEPGLDDLIKVNVDEKRLKFSSDLQNAVKESLVCFIAVGTPQSEDGAADLQYVEAVAESIGKAINGYKVIVDKSTVPVGTAERVTNIIKKQTNHEFDVISNPEFLKQGAAVDDFLKPDRVVIGSNSQRATEIMQELYAPFLRTGNPVIIMDVKSAEMTKYAANSFLAVKISYANEIANICEAVGADAEMVRIGMCSDKRIGSQFLFPGLGYGGSCFPKDVKALIRTAEKAGYTMKVLHAVEEVNEAQKQVLYRKLEKYYNGDLAGKTVALWGLSFKPETDDMREATSLVTIRLLQDSGCRVKVYDPVSMKECRRRIGNSVEYAADMYEAVLEADALLLHTEWKQFRMPSWGVIKKAMKTPLVIDGRNIYDAEELKKLGFAYLSIGR